MENKKYELTNETIELSGKTLYRIRYLRAGKWFENGDLGGFVESEKNLSQEGDACILGNACVSGDACVCGNACVSGDAWVHGNAYVRDNACVCGNACVSGGTNISDNSYVITGIFMFDNIEEVIINNSDRNVYSNVEDFLKKI